MADLGRAVLTIGGYYAFGPVGAVVGGLIGDVLFPTTLADVKGPRLKELAVQRSTVGAPIPICYGTGKMAGNIIFTSGLIEEEETEEQGGKGGSPSQTVTTYSYFVDLAIGLCDGEDGRPSKPQGIRKIWAYGDLIYDLSPQRADETAEQYAERLATSEQTAAMMTIYPGDETQLPSPMIESYKGVGNVPAYRGLYHVEFERFPLNKYGKAIPNFTFEIYTGTASVEDCTTYSVGNLHPWIEGGNDPRNDLNAHRFQGDGSTWRTTFEAAVADVPSNYQGGIRSAFLANTFWGWSPQSSLNSTHNPCAALPSNDRIEVTMWVNSLSGSGENCTTISNPGAGFLCTNFEAAFGQENVVHWSGETTVGHESSGFYVLTAPSVGESTYFSGQSEPGSYACTGSRTLQWISDAPVTVQRLLTPPDPCSGGVALPNAPGFCVVNGQVVRSTTCTLTAGTFKALQEYVDDGTFVTQYPVNPCLPSTDPNYNSQAFWEAAYAQALADGEPIASGLVYGVDYPVVVSSAYVCECASPSVDTVCVTMASIVADICERAGLTAVDVSDLTTCPDGYVVTRQMSARDALTPLRMYGLWDCVESDAVLKFIERGHAIVASFTADDLGVYEAGSEAPSLMETSRVQEKDLPRRVRLHYADIDQSHEPGEQSASRLATEATTELDVEMAISMTADYAAQLSEILLYEQWVARNTYRFSLDNAWLALEPADCLEIPVDGETERVRITAVDYSIGGILRIEAIRDDDGSYVSTAVATPAEPSGSGEETPSGIVCPSEMVLLDLPRLRDADVDCGVYAAVYGLCDAWECAAIYRSSDGGATYGRIARTDIEATVGEIIDITGSPSVPSIYPAYDTTNVITVTLFNGTLSSVTDAQIETGANAAAIGLDGRWVIIQFKTAVMTTANTWELSDLLWGLRETGGNLGTTIDGDTFVLLNDSALLRLPETRANFGIQKLYKVVTCGQSIDDAEAIPFTTQCLSYKPDLVSEDPPDPLDTGDVLNNADCTQILKWNEITEQYEPGQLRLAEACDVQLDSPPTIGDHLAIVGEDSSGPIFGFVPDIGGTGGTSSVQFLDDLLDVQIDSPLSEGDVLTYDGTSSLWRNEPGGTGAGGDETYLTLTDESVSLPNSLRLVAGSGVDFDVDTSNTLTINAAAGSGPRYTIYANSDVTRTSTTTLADDPVLVAVLTANKKYKLEFHVYVQTTQTPDLKIDFNFTGTTTSVLTQTLHGVWTTANLPTGFTETTFSMHGATALNIVRNFTIAAADTVYINSITNIEVGASGGTFSFRWAQGTSSGVDTIRLRNSTLTVTECI